MRFTNTTILSVKDLLAPTVSPQIKKVFVHKVSSGHLIILPLGQLLLDAITKIVDDHMKQVATRITLPTIQPLTLLEATGRDRHLLDSVFIVRKDHFLTPTCEEGITYFVKSFLQSYRALPLSYYQINTKYRDEKRARGDLLRSREFMMKDCYSFHVNIECLESYYKCMADIYKQIFAKMNLPVKEVEADASSMCGFASKEYHILCEKGDDTIIRLPNTWINKEISHLFSEQEYAEEKSIEIAHIFMIGSHFSQKLNLTCVDSFDRQFYPLMGCYGIGLTRLLGIVIDIFFLKRTQPLPLDLILFDFYIKFKQSVDADLTATLQTMGYNIVLDEQYHIPAILVEVIKMTSHHEIIVDNKKPSIYLVKKGQELKYFSDKPSLYNYIKSTCAR